jgi:hypothetical protein
MIEHDRPWDRRPWKPTFMGYPVVGTLQRSTHEEMHPDSEWQAVSDVLYWSWCIRLQAGRLRGDIQSELTSRSRLYPWQRKRFATTSFDEHVLVVAGGSLYETFDRFGKYLRGLQPPQETLKILHLLRNVYEHWYGTRATFRKGGTDKSGAALRITEKYPGAEPWRLDILCEKGDVLLARKLSLAQMVEDLRKLEAAAHWRARRLQREGRHKPKESSSSRRP